MIYETRIHKSRPVQDAAEAVLLLARATSAKVIPPNAPASPPPTYEAIVWEENGTTFALAADDLHHTWAETAMLQKIGDQWIQTESFTVGWYSNVFKLMKDVMNNQVTPCWSKPTTFLLDTAPTDQTAYFTCGCCGSGFRDSVAKQLEFDQDTGYGICPSCEAHYK